MKIEIFKGKDGFYWRIRARNGRILAVSESYKTKRNCCNTVTNLNYSAYDYSGFDVIDLTKRRPRKKAKL